MLEKTGLYATKRTVTVAGTCFEMPSDIQLTVGVASAGASAVEVPTVLLEVNYLPCLQQELCNGLIEEFLQLFLANPPAQFAFLSTPHSPQNQPMALPTEVPQRAPLFPFNQYSNLPRQYSMRHTALQYVRLVMEMQVQQRRAER